MAHSMPFQFGALPSQHNTSQTTAHPMSNGHNAPVMPSTGMQPQQPNPPQTASLPGLPPHLAALLQGVSPEQLMGILQALQSGQLPGLPQAVPTVPAPHVQQPGGPLTVAQLSAPSEQDVDMDKEEGELEEGQELDIPPENSIHAPRAAPSIPSATMANPHARGQGKGRDRRDQNTVSSHQATTRRSSNDVTSSQRDASMAGSNVPATSHRNTGASARSFVLQMHNAGYTFDQLAQDITNREALRRMYKTLGLPLSAEGRANGTAAPPPPVVQLDGASTVTSGIVEERTLSATKRPPPPRPAAPADRAEYLAKLAAARTSRNKPTGASATNQPAQTPARQTAQKVSQAPAPAALPVPVVAAPTPAAAIVPPSNTSRPNVQPSGRSVIQTELIKQRLEALKAEQAAKKLAAQSASGNAASPSLVVPSTVSMHANSTAQQPLTSGLGAGLVDAARYAVPATHTATPSNSTFSPSIQPSYFPFPSTPGRSFGSLPGLFMASTPAQTSKMHAPPAPRLSNPAADGAIPAQPTPTSSSTQAAFNRPAASSPSFNPSEKRAGTTDFDEDSSARGQDTSNKRPLFGQSRSNSDSERVVIEVSDNEDDDDIEIDTTTTQPAMYGTTRSSISLPGLQQRLSGLSTPSSPQVAVDMDLRIAELKRKIAEKEASKAQAKTSGARPPASTSASGQATPSLNISSTRDQLQESRIVAAEHVLAAAGSPTNTSTVANTTRKQEMNQLSQRLLQLQEQVARHDGVVASASPLQTRSQPPVPESTTFVSAPVQHTAAIAALSPQVPSSEDNTAQDSTLAPAVQPVQLGKAPSGAVGGGDENQNDSQATTVSEMAEPDSTNTDTVMIVDDLPAIELEVPQAASAVMSAPESLDDDVEMEEDSSDEQESESENEDDDDDDDGSIEDTEVASARGKDESDIGLPDLDSRTQVRPAIELLLEDSGKDTGDGGQQVLQGQSSGAEEGEVDDDDDDDDDDDEEEYEPTPEMEIVSIGEPVQENQPQRKEDDSMLLATELSTSVHHQAARAEDVRDVEAIVQPTAVIAQATAPREISDDLAPELQPAIADQVAVGDQGTANEPKPHYRPYESPLTQFKDYRYHPDFLQQVSDGYRSLTYSHRIDPIQPLCSAEAAGNACRDLKCPNQHFRSMGLTDNQLLKLLGTHRTPTTSVDAKVRWNKGLTELVAHLRATPASKDANAIATNIAQYRRDFVGDESSVLFLG